MPAVHEVIQRLEGLTGIIQANLPVADTGRGLQSVVTWVEGCKAIMRQVTNRNRTDWDFVMVDGLAPAGAVADATTGFLYGILIRQDASDAERDWVAWYDAAAVAFDGTAIGSTNTMLGVFQVPAAATNNISEFHGLLFPNGQEYPLTGLSISADGRDGTDPITTANAADLSAYFLIRT